jgi:hypothetical protein
MLRIRHDKPLWQADSLATLEAWIAGRTAAGSVELPDGAPLVRGGAGAVPASNP